MTTDWVLLINWLISGLIGFAFGCLGAFVAHSLRKKQLDYEFGNRLKEIEYKLEKEAARRESAELKDKLVRGVDDYPDQIKVLQYMSKRLQSGSLRAASETGLNDYTVIMPQNQLLPVALLVFDPENPLTVDEFVQIQVLLEKNPSIASANFIPGDKNSLFLSGTLDSLLDPYVSGPAYWRAYTQLNEMIVRELGLVSSNLPAIVIYPQIDSNEPVLVSLANHTGEDIAALLSADVSEVLLHGSHSSCIYLRNLLLSIFHGIEMNDKRSVTS